MALLTDGPACGIDDLTDHDSGLLEVAEGGAINVSTKIRVAQEEIVSELETWLLRGRNRESAYAMRHPSISQAVVTPNLKRWVVFHALELVYRDAYFSQMVDRHQAKWQGFSRLARDAREGVITVGLGMVTEPLSRPAPPVLTSATGPQAGGTFYACISWVGTSGQESQGSPAASITVDNGQVMVVTPALTPANANGYKVYAGPTLSGLILQTSLALPLTTPFRYLPDQVFNGDLPGTGQAPEFVRALPRTWMRG